MVNLKNGEQRECLFQELLHHYRAGFTGRRLSRIIHAFNTPLQIILTQSELLERKLQEEGDHFAPKLPPELLSEWQTFFHYRQKKNQQLQEVAHDLQRFIHWLKHLTYYEDHHGIQEIELNELLVEELAGYQADDFYKFRVAKNFQWLDRLPPIAGFYVDFSQSVCNLIDNALEALREVPEPVLSLSTTLASGRRVIAVADNGPGIPEDMQETLFTPFFSTKASQKKPCAGLGLFLARRLLTPYNGEIAFESRPGQTCFRIILP